MEKKNNKKREILKGRTICPGHAMGRAFIYRDILSWNFNFYSIEREDVSNELQRIKGTFGDVLKDLKNLEKNVKDELGKGQSNIFKVHSEILKDKILLKDIEEEIKKELVNAEHVVRNVFRKWADRYRMSENEAIRSKADDIEDLTRRVLNFFTGHDANILKNTPPNSVLVAKRLLPSDTVGLKKKGVRGIVVEQGSGVSHSAIIARSLGIPCITGIENAVSVITPGERLIIDGEEGTVICDPGGDELDSFKKITRAAREKEARSLKKAKRVSRTRDGRTVKVYANAASGEDSRTAVEKGCDGIGLLRIEQIYMASKMLPDEKYLLRKMSGVLAPVKKKVSTIRLLDIGADKKLPYIEIEDEPNPVLGLRGIRLLLKYETLLRTQLKTVIVLSKSHNVRVLVPMVTFPDEMVKVRKITEDCIKELKHSRGIRPGKIKIGAMVETPAAVENINKICLVSDFLSIGTNDLIQYSVAAGRDNPGVSEYYERGSGLVMKYIKRIVRAADRHGIECGICGEMAGDLNWVKPVIGLDIRSLSVSPYLVPSVKEKIRTI